MADDRPEESSEQAQPEAARLTEEQKAALAEALDDVDASVKAGRGEIASMKVASLVGDEPELLKAAFAHLAALRVERIRTAAMTKGFRVGI